MEVEFHLQHQKHEETHEEKKLHISLHRVFQKSYLEHTKTFKTYAVKNILTFERLRKGVILKRKK